MRKAAACCAAVAAQAPTSIGKRENRSATGIAVDLHAATAIVLRIELQIRKARAGHQQCVALFHRGTSDGSVPRRPIPPVGGTAGVVRYDRFAQQRFDDRSGAIKNSASRYEFQPGAQRSLPGQDAPSSFPRSAGWPPRADVGHRAAATIGVVSRASDV